MSAQIPFFSKTIAQHGLVIERVEPEILQINVGKLCNQACHHCHVEAGPKRKEIMTDITQERLLTLLENAPSIHTVDLTGGAPELNPHFKSFVTSLRKLKKNVINRCNLTVLFVRGQETTAQFLADQRVHIVASLPCYSKDNVDKQRGSGVFEKSIRALVMLNSLGYGQPNSGLKLSLVYNPVGAFLPPDQRQLEIDYKNELRGLFGIEFTELLTITNMPIKRFLTDLEKAGKLEEYMQLLVDSFNPQTAAGVMCRNVISVGWDGQLYDCDFNQMLEMPAGNQQRTIWQLNNLSDLKKSPIAFAEHCYGCTAGAGSSCGGSLL